MTVLTTPLSIIGLLAVFFMLFMLANLSRRLGAVTKMKPYYRGFYVAMAILVVPFIARVMRSSMALSPSVGPTLLNNPVFYLFTYHLPSAIALTLSIAVAWRYWGWLFLESQP
jgi:chromate transport protein ChrA